MLNGISLVVAVDLGSNLKGRSQWDALRLLKHVPTQDSGHTPCPLSLTWNASTCSKTSSPKLHKPRPPNLGLKAPEGPKSL